VVAHSRFASPPIRKPAPTAFSDDHIRERLMRFLWLYETLVIAIVAGAGLNIALMGGGSLPMAAPLVLISCAQALRIPLSAMATRLRWGGQLLAAITLLAIATVSAEGIAVAIEAFLQNRVVDITRANAAADRAQRTVDQIADERKHADAAIASLDAQVAALAKSMPQPPASSNKTCSGRRGQRVSCGSDSIAAAAYAASMRSYDARLADLTGRRSGLQARVDAAREKQPSAASLADAERALDDELQLSVMHRLAASIYGVRASEVTEGQFNALKRFVVLGLACTISLLSAVVSVIAHVQPKGDRPSKLNRMIRGWLARRRRPIYRDVPGPTQYQDRVIVRWRGYDVARGVKCGAW
jgi:hypothetical protein